MAAMSLPPRAATALAIHGFVPIAALNAGVAGVLAGGAALNGLLLIVTSCVAPLLLLSSGGGLPPAG